MLGRPALPIVAASMVALFPPPLGAIPRCGPELDSGTSLARDFGVNPDTLAWLSDEESMILVAEETKRVRSHRFALSRGAIWDSILRFRGELGPHGFEIPVRRGRWRHGRVRHPGSGTTYDLVHWADGDGLHSTFYFRRGTSLLCQHAKGDR